MRCFSIMFLLTVGVLPIYGESWIEKLHDDFADGWEYYYVNGDTATVWSSSGLRKWRLGSVIYSPSSGGIRIIGKDWDLDDNGWLDVVLTDEGSGKVDIYWNDSAGFNIQNNYLYRTQE